MMATMVMNKILKNIGLVCLVSGALCTSLRYDPWNIYLLNSGSLAYLLWSLRVKDHNLAIMNGGMLSIYCIGLFIGQ